MAEPASAASDARWEIVDAHRCTACGFLSQSALEITEHLRTHAAVCEHCNGSGMDRTWHEGAPCAEVHQCGYCMGDTARPSQPKARTGEVNPHD